MPHPTEDKLHQASRVLEIAFDDGQTFRLPYEYLRVYSPSAEVRGHGNPVLQHGKLGVGLSGVEPVGQYALKLIFDDGHDSGLYSWDYLYQLARDHDRLWVEYLAELERAGKSRDPDESVVRLML